MLQGSLFANVPAALPVEWITSLLSTPHLRVERIVSRGHVSPEGFWYDQAEHEFVVVIQGLARVELEGASELTLQAGDYLHIPAHVKHRVTFTAPDVDTIWLAVFCPV